jgi:hypothetical protein
VSGEKDAKVTLDFGLGAKASLEAKVSTEIPAQSSGRFLDALTDIIRPFSERRGLKADQIRLQREEVLIKVARKARRRMEIENQPIRPPPNKFLVPFLEKASLEEVDSVLIDRWADLLAICSADPPSAHPRFVQILSEMVGNDIQLLHSIAFNCIDDGSNRFLDCYWRFDSVYLRDKIEEFFRKLETSQNQNDLIDRIYDHTIKLFEYPGVSLLEVEVITRSEHWGLDRNMMERKPPAELKHSSILDILYSLQVLKECNLTSRVRDLEFNVQYVCITSLGVEFMTKCDRELRDKLGASATQRDWPDPPQPSERPVVDPSLDPNAPVRAETSRDAVARCQLLTPYE